MNRRFLSLWAVAVFATVVALLVHLTLRFETVRLGYEVDAARKEQRRLVEEKRLLAIEAATLRQPDRVRQVAREALQMDVPQADRVVPVGARRVQQASGRVR